MVNGSAAAMRCGLEFFGAERVMYGTDFPMGPAGGEDWPVEVLDTIRFLGLDAADLDLILSGNLHRIVDFQQRPWRPAAAGGGPAPAACAHEG